MRGRECRETAGSKSVRFADKVSFMEGHGVADLKEAIRGAAQCVAEPALVRTVNLNEDVNPNN